MRCPVKGSRPESEFMMKAFIRWLSAKQVCRCAVLLAVLCFAAAARAQEVQIYVSSQAGDRLAQKPALHFDTAGSTAAAQFEVNDAVTYQRIEGFGASFMEAGLIAINSLPLEEQESVLRAMFDPRQGAGF